MIFNVEILCLVDPETPKCLFINLKVKRYRLSIESLIQARIDGGVGATPQICSHNTTLVVCN